MSTSFKSTSGGDGTIEADVVIVGSTTISGTEIAFIDGVTAGTVTASKAVVVDADKHIDTIVIADGGLKLGAGAGTAVTSTAAELNILDGVTASAAELNLIDGSVAGTAVASKAAVLGANKNLDVLAIADGGLSLGAGAGTAITSTAAELNLVDGSIAGTAVASKAAVLGANKNLDTLVIADSGLFLGAGAGTAVTATAAELNQSSVEVGMVDAGTAQSRYVVAPHAGNIVAAYVVNSVANTTTKTVFTLKIATVLVTMPAWEVAITQAAGTVSSSVPTAANTVTAGQAIEVISDGGTDAVMPVTVTLVISR